MCGSSASARPGATARFGPTKLSGETRSENTGSVMRFSAPNCASIVAWPTQVSAGCIVAPARALAWMNAVSGATRGVGVAGGRGRPSRAALHFHFNSSPRLLGSNSM